MRALLARVAGFAVRCDHRFVAARRAAARYHYRPKFAACGPGVQFDPISSDIQYPLVSIGANVHLGPGAVIGRAVIGNDVMLGPNVSIFSGNHFYEIIGSTVKDPPHLEDPYAAPVRIDDDVWIGEGSSILRNGHIGEGSIVGAKSLVSRSIPPYVIAAGHPARVIRLRFADDQLREHLRMRGRSAEYADRIISDRALALGGVLLDETSTAEVTHGDPSRQPKP